MPTIDKAGADNLVRNKGLFNGEPEAPDNPQCVKIVKYQNYFNGADAYGVIYEGYDLENYAESEYVRNPITYWVHKP